MHIGQKIADARKARGWSQTKLADAVNQAQTTISSWERGRTEPSRADVEKVSLALGVPIEADLNASGGASRLIRVLGRAGDAPDGTVTPVFDLWAPSIPGAPGDTIIVEVSTQLREFADEGTLLYFGFVSDRPADAVLDAVSIVKMDGDELPRIGRLLRGSVKGRFDFAPFMGPKVRDAAVNWAAELIGHLAARQARELVVLKAGNAA
jgi:transcriptional regulator with XRE-family HTH domain